MVTLHTTLHKTLDGRFRPSNVVSDFEKIAAKILSNRYSLSIVFIGDKYSRRLNRTYRAKDYPTNVLAFPYSEKEGEIFINIPKTLREAKKFSSTPAQHLRYLFVHGLLHLKGYDHGEEMERQEKKLLKIL